MWPENICTSIYPTGPYIDNSVSGCMQSSSCDPYLAKRRTANHPCPVCGKHYVNEGSLRKHLACHPETTQLTNSLRMWPCSVCQAVFTHENGKKLFYKKCPILIKCSQENNHTPKRREKLCFSVKMYTLNCVYSYTTVYVERK